MGLKIYLADSRKAFSHQMEACSCNHMGRVADSQQNF